jgi:hypothetical protein
MTNLTHNSFLYISFNSLHVSSNPVLIIRRISCINKTSGICHSVSVTVSSPTQSDIYQRLYWYNWFSWWWARGCSKHVENWNKYIVKNCASNWSFTKSRHNVTCLKTAGVWTPYLAPSCVLKPTWFVAKLLGFCFNTLYRESFIILYYDQQVHNYYYYYY